MVLVLVSYVRHLCSASLRLIVLHKFGTIGRIWALISDCLVGGVFGVCMMDFLDTSHQLVLLISFVNAIELEDFVHLYQIAWLV